MICHLSEYLETLQERAELPVIKVNLSMNLRSVTIVMTSCIRKSMEFNALNGSLPRKMLFVFRINRPGLLDYLNDHFCAIIGFYLALSSSPFDSLN